LREVFFDLHIFTYLRDVDNI